jgi:hypothetical protein
MMTEDPANPPIVITILTENIPLERQPRLYTVITKSPGPVHQCRKCSFFIGWVVAGLGIKVEIDVGGLVVHFVAQTAIMPPANIYVQEGEVACSFGYHS